MKIEWISEYKTAFFKMVKSNIMHGIKYIYKNRDNKIWG